MDTKVVIGVTAVVSLAAGAAGGYFFARHKFEEQLGVFAEELDGMQAAFDEKIEAFEDVRRHIRNPNQFESPEAAWAAFHDSEPIGKASVEETEAGISIVVDDPEAIDTIKSIFAGGEDELDDAAVEAEVAARSDQKPYILSADEFLNDESGYEKITLTYFEGDKVLVDDQEAPVPNPDKLVGTSNLRRFGYRSQDRNVVYVRNSHLKLEFEILRSEGKYMKEVHGIPDEPIARPSRKQSRR
jgi:hypothetical protein